MSLIAEQNEAIYTGRVARQMCYVCGVNLVEQPHKDGCYAEEYADQGDLGRLRDHIDKTGEAYDEARQAALDNVNSPPHYKQGDIECIDAIEAALTAEEFRGYCKGNALKYVWREKHKGQNESLKKAIWYLNRALGE